MAREKGKYIQILKIKKTNLQQSIIIIEKEKWMKQERNQRMKCLLIVTKFIINLLIRIIQRMYYQQKTLVPQIQNISNRGSFCNNKISTFESVNKLKSKEELSINKIRNIQEEINNSHLNEQMKKQFEMKYIKYLNTSKKERKSNKCLNISTNKNKQNKTTRPKNRELKKMFNSNYRNEIKFEDITKLIQILKNHILCCPSLQKKLIEEGII